MKPVSSCLFLFAHSFPKNKLNPALCNCYSHIQLSSLSISRPKSSASLFISPYGEFKWNYNKSWLKVSGTSEHYILACLWAHLTMVLRAYFWLCFSLLDLLEGPCGELWLKFRLGTWQGKYPTFACSTIDPCPSM